MSQAILDPVSLGILTTIAGGLSVTAIVALARKSPQVMGWVKAYVIGKGLLVLGRPIAGKTSTVNYLRYGQLPTARRPRMTTGIKESSPFRFGQKDDKLSMYIRMATDVPGDLGIVDQLDVLTRRKPAILLVFISLAPVTDRKKEYKDYQATQQLKLWEAEILWLHNFADGLKSVFLRNQEVRKKLKVLVFIVTSRIWLIPTQRLRDVKKPRILSQLSWNRLLAKNLSRSKFVRVPFTMRYPSTN
jgi:hypothetical protein